MDFCSARIVADASPTEIYITEVSFMYRLFRTEPGMETLSFFRDILQGMQQRFFKKAAVKLAGRLRELGQSKDSKPKEEAQVLEHAPSALRDKAYVDLFSLPETEVVIQGLLLFMLNINIGTY